MEKEKNWGLTAYGTKINLHKEDMLNFYADETKKAEIVIVVGQYKQEELGETSEIGNPTGTCCSMKSVRFTPKENSNNYQKACSNHWQFLRRDGINFLSITEPQVIKYKGYRWEYCRYKGLFETEEYAEDEALKEGCKDLDLCYTKVLDEGLKIVAEKQCKNIALPRLSAESKYTEQCMPKDRAAQVATKTIFEFIKKHPNAYNCVELFVKEDFEFDMYKGLLMRENGLDNLCILACAHKHSHHLLSIFPRDIILYIAKLI
jgi:hypothetical protein